MAYDTNVRDEQVVVPVDVPEIATHTNGHTHAPVARLRAPLVCT